MSAMMTDLLTVDRVIPRLRARDKRDAFRKLARLVCRQSELPERDVLDALMRCAQLPAFGPGRGVALPHAFIPQLEKSVAFLARLESPIDFDAADGRPVDLLVLLLGPVESSGDHLRALACIARRLRQYGVRERLRACRDRDAMYIVLVGNDVQDDPAHAAARVGGLSLTFPQNDIA